MAINFRKIFSIAKIFECTFLALSQVLPELKKFQATVFDNRCHYRTDDETYA